MALWRSGLTHRPLKATFTGSNPVRVTNRENVTFLHHRNVFFFAYIQSIYKIVNDCWKIVTMSRYSVKIQSRIIYDNK